MFHYFTDCLNIENSDLSAVLVGGNCSATFDYSLNDPDCGKIIRSDCSCYSVDAEQYGYHVELDSNKTEEYTQILDCEFGFDSTRPNTEVSYIYGEFFDSYLKL